MQDNDGNVREMTRTEKVFYKGVTIDANSTEGNSSEENFREQNSRTHRIYVSYGNPGIFSRLIGSFIKGVLGGNRLARLAALLIGLAFAALMIFVALPIFFFILAAGIVTFALLNNFR